jgi:23S rRNA pseudouridine2605 synthase
MQERLQKIIAAAGIASRRAAEEMITGGEVTVNGKLVTELGAKADPERDHIKVRGKLIANQNAAREKRYYLLNKPRGYLSSVSDPLKRPLVSALLPVSVRRGLHPVGRLDFNSEGLIILTTDGELTKLLTQGGKVAKVYHVKVKGSPADQHIERLRKGIRLEGTRTAPAEIKMIERTKEGGNAWFEVTLHQGKNQQIRRMFDSIHHSVTKLRRVRIGHITDAGLAVGQYREMTSREINRFFKPEPPVARRSQKRPGQKRTSKKQSSKRPKRNGS